MKTLKSREFVQIKNQAKVIASSLKAKENALAKLNKVQAELDRINKDIEVCDSFIFDKYGVHIEDVVKRVSTKTINAEGKELYKTEFKPTDIVVWNEETKVYEIAEPEVEVNEAVIEDNYALND